jgi:lipopolysaccharide transport system permease protein
VIVPALFRVADPVSSTESTAHVFTHRETADRGILTAHSRRILDLVLYKTYAELKAEAKRTYVGLLWWIVEPIIFMLIFYFVFGVLLGRNQPDFVPFLLVGLVLWHWFQATITQCSNAITANQPLLQQVVVPKALFPTVIVVTNTIKFAFVALILVTFLLMYGITPGVSWLYGLPVLMTMLMFITGLSFLFAATVPLVPDIRVLIDNAFRALFFLSGSPRYWRTTLLQSS